MPVGEHTSGGFGTHRVDTALATRCSIRSLVLRAQRGLGLTVAVAVLGGCSGSQSPDPDTPSAQPISDGPIVFGGLEGETCVSAGPSTADVTYGFDGVGNTSNEILTLTQVELIGADNLTVSEALLVPVDGAFIGNSSSWPPQIASQIEGWADRAPVVGAAVSADTPIPRANLVLHLSLDTVGRDAGFDAIKLSYVNEQGDQFVASSTASFAVRKGC